MKNFFNVVLLALFGTSFAQAQGGKTLQYEVANGNEAKVSKQQRAKISGDVKVPESVTFEGEKYRVTTIGESAFGYCDGLTSVTIPNSVTSIEESAFSHCYGLTSVTIPNGVTTIGKAAFEECTGLTSVTIPNSVTTIGEGAFLYCPGLTSVIIPNSVTTIGKAAFAYCENLKSINVAKDNSHYCSENGVLFDITKKRLTQCPSGIKGNYAIPDGVTTIGDAAFLVCAGLTSVTILNSVTSIGEYAFYGCDGLTILTIENVTSPDVRYLAFEGVSENITIYVPAESVEKYKAARVWSEYADKIKAKGK